MVNSVQKSLFLIRLSLVVAACLAFTASSVWAFGSTTTEEKLEEAQDAIDANSFDEAIDILQEALEDDPDNADAYNLLAYSQRSLDQTDVAMENYRRALEIDPEHKGALEYQGELFLLLGDRAAAEANLVKLSQICPRGCEEHEELQAAIERYKDGNLSWKAPQRRNVPSE